MLPERRQLRAKVADFVDRVVQGSQPARNLLFQIELLFEVGGRQLDARVLAQFERRGLALASNCETHLVCAGKRHGALWGDIAFVKRAWNLHLIWLAQIPKPAAATRLRGPR